MLREGIERFKAYYKTGQYPDDYFESMKNLLQMIANVDRSVRSNRTKIMGFFLGEAASEFATYYNSVSGRGIVSYTIEDLVDKTKIRPYIDQVFSKNSTGISTDTVALDIMADVEKRYQASLSYEHYRELIEGLLIQIPSADAKSNFIKAICVSNLAFARIFIVAENRDADWIYSIADSAGMNLSRDKIKEILDRTNGKSAAPKNTFVLR